MAYTAQDVIKLYDSAGKEPYNDEVCESIAVVANLNDIDLMTAAEIITRKRVEDEPDWPEDEEKEKKLNDTIERTESGTCPLCHGNNIEGHEIEVVDDCGCVQQVVCLDCGAEWTDYYEIKESIITYRPEKTYKVTVTTYSTVTIETEYDLDDFEQREAWENDKEEREKLMEAVSQQILTDLGQQFATNEIYERMDSEDINEQ